jgi:hypothetical protein
MYGFTLPLTSALDGGGCLKPYPGRFTPGNDPVLLVLEVGSTPGAFWKGTENLAPHRDSIPDRLARRGSL